MSLWSCCKESVKSGTASPLIARLVRDLRQTGRYLLVNISSNHMLPLGK